LTSIQQTRDKKNSYGPKISRKRCRRKEGAKNVKGQKHNEEGTKGSQKIEKLSKESAGDMMNQKVDGQLR
jgi:hypothetical protein